MFNVDREKWQKDQQYFIHPFTDFGEFVKNGSSQLLTAGAGAYIFDSADNRYLDGLAGIQCVNIGYSRNEIARAISNQILKLSYACNFTDVTNDPAILLAERLAKLAPQPINHVLFSTCGSMAVETAYRLICFYQNIRNKPKKKQVLALKNSYHGSTHLTMSLGGKFDERGQCDHINGGIHHLSCPNYFRAPAGMSEEKFLGNLITEFEDKIAELGADNIAAFFVEPVQGAGGSIVPPPGYHKAVESICRENDIIIVADEVVTGFGRLGHWFSCEEYFEFVPDILTTAKGLTSAYLPLGATIISDEIYNTIAGSGEFFNHGFTYSGHPVCCAAALENIRIIEEEGVLLNVRTNGDYFEQCMQQLYACEIVGDIRGKRFIHGIEFVKARSTKEPFPVSMNVAGMITAACLKRGLNLRCLPPATVVLTPPLILKRQEIDFIVETLFEAVSEVEQAL